MKTNFPNSLEIRKIYTDFTFTGLKNRFETIKDNLIITRLVNRVYFFVLGKKKVVQNYLFSAAFLILYKNSIKTILIVILLLNWIMQYKDRLFFFHFFRITSLPIWTGK